MGIGSYIFEVSYVHHLYGYSLANELISVYTKQGIENIQLALENKNEKGQNAKKHIPVSVA